MYYQESGAKIFWISFTTALVVSAMVSFAFLYFSPSFMQRSDGGMVEAPNVEHLDLEKAKMIVDRSGLSLIVEDRKEDQSVPEGKIIYQKPPQGTEMKKGEILRVVVSKGISVPEEGEIVVPDLTGFDVNQARVLLSEKNLNAGKIEKETSDRPEDEVINSIPAPGKKVPEGFSVKLIVSSGPGKVTVPDLRRKSVAAARRILNERGLDIGSINSTTNIEYPFDLIVSQRPSAGSMVERDSKVDITVNREGY